MAKIVKQEDPQEEVVITQGLYEEWKVEPIYNRDGSGNLIDISYEKVRLIKDNIRIESWRAEGLNEQSRNSKVRYYEKK